MSNLPNSLRSPVAIGTLLTVTLLALGPLSRLAAQQLFGDTPRTSSRTQNRLREGTELVNVVGTFKLTGDRATFFPADNSGRYGGLENQTLERVAAVITEDTSPLEWIVSGTITEYKGNNYLLLNRAILKSKPAAGGRPLP